MKGEPMTIEFPIPETYGWDTVFAIDISEVNRALAALQPSEAYTATSPVQGGSATVNWAFRNWRITDTPGGNKIEVALDFAPGSTLIMPGGEETALDGWTCKIVFEAHFDEVDPVTQRLKARTAAGDDWASVSVELPAGLDPNDYFNEFSTIDQMVTQWFLTAPEAVTLFEQEFATVDIGEDLAARNVYYLQPLVLGFAGAVMADGITRALGILAMTRDSAPGEEDADPEAERRAAQAKARTATLQLSPYAILPNARAGYIVSARVFLEHMMKPALASTYGADPKEGFEVHGAGTPQLRNKAKLSFKVKMKEDDRAATIAARELNFAFDGDRLRMVAAGLNIETGILGFTLNGTLKEAFAMSLVPKPDAPEETIFMLSNVDIVEPQFEPVIAVGTKIAVGVIGLVISIAGAAFMVATFKGPLATKLTADNAKLVARIIAASVAISGAIAGFVPIILEAIVHGDANKIPDFGKALNVGLRRISWPGNPETKFVPVEGHFANAMVVTIYPRFA
jgi:hypothetical protein